VLYVGERSVALLPQESDARARAVQWLVAALNDGNRFTAGDLIMTTVLRSLDHTDVVALDKRLAAYVERCASRPAFKRALDAHLQDF